MRATTERHKTTLRIPIRIWNAIKIQKLKNGTTYNKLITKTLREKFGEIEKITWEMIES